VGLYPDAPPPPCVIGYEVSGTVDAVGAGVTSPKVGERVLAMPHFGGYSDMVVVPAHQALPMPETMTFEEAAALPVVYLTAYHMLIRLGAVRKGDRVLIHSAAGGVGLAALQLCKSVGAETFGTASAHKHAALQKAGLDHAIDYTTEDFEQRVLELTRGRGVDLVLDAVGGTSFKKSFRALAPCGRLFVFGASATNEGRSRSLVAALKGILGMPFFHPIPLMNQNKGVIGVNMGHLFDEVELLHGEMHDLFDLWKRGLIKPTVDSTFPFERVGEAHGRLEARKNVGKVLLLA